VLAFFLAFTPDLVRDGHFTLPQAVWIGFTLTVFSFICFLFEKIEDAKEARQAKLEQKARDKTMEEILERVKKMQEKQPTLADAQLKQLEEAHKLYQALNESADEPSEAAVALVRRVIKNAADSLFSIGDMVAYTGIFDLAKKVFSNRSDQRNELRRTADSLALSALAPPKNNTNTVH
jgi:hypothetical protein